MTANDVTYKFKSESSFVVCGKGNAFAVKNPTTCTEFSHLVNQIVEIDGDLYKVIGIERFMHCPPWKKDEPIALLVKEIEENT